ncbi:MAG: hypothetical protein AB1896_23465, partial [Thermodesulfobacteriota bacterium]
MIATRRAEPRILYEGKDITAALTPHLLSLTYTDHVGQIDDLSIALEDRDLKWQGPWTPQKNARLDVIVTCRDWFKAGDAPIALRCGTFRVDTITLTGPPDTVQIQALPVRIDESLRYQKKTRAWENVTLEEIARRIATQESLNLFWEAEAKQSFYRVDQRDESDLSFLDRLVKEQGLNMQIAEEKVIIFEGRTYDLRPS